MPVIPSSAWFCALPFISASLPVIATSLPVIATSLFVIAASLFVIARRNDEAIQAVACAWIASLRSQ
ncbi:MAG: hypothetical protein LBJ47_06075 [Tannerella sp.]|nr:hypothetical protein [Tannerella sp.]